MDYLSKPLSRRSSQRSSRASSPSLRFARRAAPRKLNFALMEDPLLATMAANNNSMPLTPPPDESSFQNLDAFTKMPDTPMADQFAIDELESEQSEPALDFQSSHLVTHAKVYAIAEKYVSPFVILCFSFLPDNTPLLVGPSSFASAVVLPRLCGGAPGCTAANGRQTPRFASPPRFTPINRECARAITIRSPPLQRPLALASAIIHVRSYQWPVTVSSACSRRTASACNSTSSNCVTSQHHVALN
jgi:hypothetical protein